VSVNRDPSVRSRKSAGILLYRRRDGVLELFLVHPGGPLWARKDDGAWSIPKGEYTEDEAPLLAAQREFAEETGATVQGPFAALTPVKQPSGKLITAWAAAEILIRASCAATTSRWNGRRNQVNSSFFPRSIEARGSRFQRL
jgi:predicted NUDIX family NTP pyrophosphohydrolase